MLRRILALFGSREKGTNPSRDPAAAQAEAAAAIARMTESFLSKASGDMQDTLEKAKTKSKSADVTPSSGGTSNN